MVVGVFVVAKNVVDVVVATILVVPSLLFLSNSRNTDRLAAVINVANL